MLLGIDAIIRRIPAESGGIRRNVHHSSGVLGVPAKTDQCDRMQSPDVVESVLGLPYLVGSDGFALHLSLYCSKQGSILVVISITLCKWSFKELTVV